MSKSTENSEATEPRVLPSPRQCRAARGLLKWTQEDLATASGVARATIERYEQETRPIQEETLSKILDAFARRGIVFRNGNTPTVMLDPSRAILPH